MYKVKLQANNTEYKGKGDSIQDALKSLGVSYLDIKTKGTITLTKGKYEIEKFFFLRQLRRLFVSSLIQRHWERDMDKYFDILKAKGVAKKQL